MAVKELGEEHLQFVLSENVKEEVTNIALQHWVLTIVHKAMVDFYGKDYSTRCMECAMGVHRVLAKYDLAGPITMGALCIPMITPDQLLWGWAGFWGLDHHFWATTKKGEIVDLAMSQNHLHPKTSQKNQMQPPAVWFSVKRDWPDVIMHMPQVFLSAAVSENDQATMEKYLERIDRIEVSMRRRKLREVDVAFSGAALVSGLPDFDRLMGEGDPWCSRAHHFFNIPKPKWVADRIEELRAGMLESRLPIASAPIVQAS